MNINKRFRELAIKHANETITPAEQKKLDRLQKLRRPKRTLEEIQAESKRRFEVETLLKKLRRFERESRRSKIGPVAALAI